MLITVETEVFLSPARVLVNPVNSAGVMSSGVPAEFKRFFPDAFSHYRSLCESGHLEPGRLFVYSGEFRSVVNLPVKRHWRSPATTEAIEAGLQKLANIWDEQGFHAIAMPRIAEGELDWDTIVRPLIETYLAPLPIPVYLHHAPSADPRRSIRQIDQLLNLPAQYVPLNKLWSDLGRIIRRTYGKFHTAEGEEFVASQENGARFRRMSIRTEGDTQAISESALTDLWQMLNSARLVLPSQFPSGLEPLAPYLLPLMEKLEYVRVVQAAIGDGTPTSALLLVPPADTETRKLKFFPEAAS